MTDTIELFPGVQFRKDTTKPLGNQWMFLHEDHWLIAKLAYSDDLFLDHVAKIVGERDALRVAAQDCIMLATAVEKAGASAGIAVPGFPLTRQHLTAVLDALVETAVRSPLSDEIPDFGGGSGNKARRRAASLGIDMDAAMKPPITDRQCHDADCWLCDGTGQLDNGEQCDLNGKKVV